MYKFVDTIEHAAADILPSEALKLNGKFIEEAIPGYRTLNVSGREALSPELEFFETGIRDGAEKKSKKYPVRIITVKYQLLADTAEEFRAKYNQLGGILNVEDAEMIFKDEPDMYFTGTPTLIGEVEPGRNNVVGEIEFTCIDPFKYSVVEYEAIPDMIEGSILLDYQGTYKAFPVLEADFYKETDGNGETATPLTGKGDCGYVAFFNEREKIIQLGDPDEIDAEKGAYPQSQTLVNSVFGDSGSYGTSAKSQWKQNTAAIDNVTQSGMIGMKVVEYKSVESPKNTNETLLNNRATTQGAPIFYYTVKAQTLSRTADTVKITVTITTSLKYSTSYFGNPFALKGQLYIGGAWRDVVIKNPSEFWRGQTAHTKNMTFTVTGLTANTTSLTGIKFKVVRTDSTPGYDTVTGTLPETACSDLPIRFFSTSQPASYYLTASTYGNGGGWHGATITRTLPADKAGEVGAVNGALTYSNKFCIGSTDNVSNMIGTYMTFQRGAFMAYLMSGSGTGRKLVAGVEILKSANGKTAKLKFHVNGKVVHTMDVSVAHNNPYFKKGISSTIVKTNGTVAFNIGGIKKTFTDSGIATLKITECTFAFLKYGGIFEMSYNGLFGARFVKNYCETTKDIPNKFSANDIVKADCKDGKIYLNGTTNQSLGALGNDWEEFYLIPGLNQIGFSYSDWVQAEYAPQFKVRYREVFL